MDAKRAERDRERDQERATQAAARLDSKIKQSCTFSSGVSAPCAEVQRELDKQIQSGSSPSRDLTDLASCYQDAQRAKQAREGGSRDKPSTMWAGRLLQAGRGGEPAVAECLRLTDEVTGSKQWRERHLEQLAMAEYVLEVSRVVESDFIKKCGMFGQIDDKTIAIRLAVEKQSSSKKVFHTSKSPSGETHTILCSGEVLTKGPHGTSRSQPVTWAARNQEWDDLACMQSCAKKNPSCASNRNHTVEPCLGACKAVCQKK